MNELTIFPENFSLINPYRHERYDIFIKSNKNWLYYNQENLGLQSTISFNNKTAHVETEK